MACIRCCEVSSIAGLSLSEFDHDSDGPGCKRISSKLYENVLVLPCNVLL